MQKRVHFATTNTVFSTSRTPSPVLSDADHPSDDDSSEISTPPPELDYSSSSMTTMTTTSYPRSPFPHTSADLVLHPTHYHIPQQHQHQHPQHHPHHQHQHQHQQHNTSPPLVYPTHEVVPKPVPPPESGHMHIHYLLAFNPGVEIPIYFDLSRPTKQVYGNADLSELNEAATSPPLQSLIITCPGLPWEITITPISSPPTPTSPPLDEDGHLHHHLSPLQQSLLSRPDYVTVNDVLYHLFRHLRSPVTRDEYNSLAIGQTKQSVDSAYHTRCGRIPDLYYREKEESKGVKKVDFLGEAVMFKGLSWTMTDSRVWELNVGTMTTSNARGPSPGLSPLGIPVAPSAA